MPQQVVKNELEYDDFKTCLTTGDIKYNEFHTIRSINHHLHTFHCNNLRIIGREKLDSSLAFAFYLRNLNDLNDLITKIDEVNLIII